MHDKQSTTEKHAAASQTISMAMRIRWYSAKCIAQYGRSRATLDASGRCHRAVIRPELLPHHAMVIDFGVKKQVVAL